MMKWNGVKQEEWKRRGMSAIEENAKRKATERKENAKRVNMDANGKGKKG